jgi:hypothetical protein
MIWAAVAFWRRSREEPRLIYLFSMGAPLFLGYWLYTFHSRVLPNWIVPSVLPLFCLMVIYADARWRLGWGAGKRWLLAGLLVGLPVVVVLRDTNLVQKLVGVPLPPKVDPLTRVRGYRSMAAVVDSARTKLLVEGKPVFIIGSHYGITGLLSFYLPDARTNVVQQPLVYFLSSDRPMNQFYFWPGYRERCRGQNAVFVNEVSQPRLAAGWVRKWLAGEKDLRQHPPRALPPPRSLVKEFDSVTDLGLYDCRYRGRVLHTIQLFECRNLREEL